MLEARKVGKRVCSLELMASTGWFPSFPSSPEDVPHAEEVHRAASSPIRAGLPVTFAFCLVTVISFG